MGKNENGELCIIPSEAARAGRGLVFPFFVTNAALGGGDYFAQGGVYGWKTVRDPSTGKPERVWSKKLGLNNIGLLVRTTGRIIERGDGFVRIDDGSGVGVKCVLPAGVFADESAMPLSVTGISSCEKIGEELRSVILVRSLADIADLRSE